MKKAFLLIVSHTLAIALGFALGIYALPILTAPPAPTTDEVQAMATAAQYTGTFRRDLADSDAFHWGEGTLHVGTDTISLMGQLAPGPDYRLYLSPVFVETEADFNLHKASMVQVGHVKTFDNFIVPLPATISPADYTTVIIWCESFGQFITAAQYR